jgi:hypothetical protein
MLHRYPRDRVQAVWAPAIDFEENNDAMQPGCRGNYD